MAAICFIGWGYLLVFISTVPEFKSTLLELDLNMYSRPTHHSSCIHQSNPPDLCDIQVCAVFMSLIPGF